MKAVIYGSKGTLGSELERSLRLHGYEVFSFDRENSDVTDRERTAVQISKIKPDVVFNATGYNNLDKAESEPQAAMVLNAGAAANLAEVCKKSGCVLVHFSTGYIFDGSKAGGYNEDDAPNPQSVYAKSKYEGEKKVVEIAPKHYIVRLNLLFGPAGDGGNSKPTFPDIIQSAAEGKEELELVEDEISTPTYSKDLVQAVIELLEKGYPNGIYHLINEGQASWYDFGSEVFKIIGRQIRLKRISGSEYPRPAKRPANSVLINNKFPKFRSWQEALKEYLLGQKGQ